MCLAHSLLYSSPRRSAERLPNIASTRDPEANVQLRFALHDLGWGIGQSILNFPPDRQCYELLPVEALEHVELPFVSHDDILVQSTRPPLSDWDQGDRKKVEPSNTDLERAIFLHYWRYFSICSRAHVQLTEAAARFLRPGKENRAAMTFFQDGCRYQTIRRLGGPPSPRCPLGERTAAFLLRVDEAWPGGPGFVAAWGINALATLAWCILLRHRYPVLLSNRGLTMVELDPVEPPRRPTTHAWAHQWKAQILLETGTELPPRPEEKSFSLSPACGRA